MVEANEEVKRDFIPTTTRVHSVECKDSFA